MVVDFFCWMVSIITWYCVVEKTCIMMSYASSIEMWNTFMIQIMDVTFTILFAILAVTAGLISINFMTRKTKKHVTGHKF